MSRLGLWLLHTGLHSDLDGPTCNLLLTLCDNAMSTAGLWVPQTGLLSDLDQYTGILTT